MSGEARKTEVSPEVAITAAARLAARAEAALGEWESCKGEIEALHAREPWGRNYAADFRREYFDADHGADPAMTAVRALLNRIRDHGTAIGIGVLDTEAEDEESGRTIGGII